LASTDGSRVWRCECGWEIAEAGDGRGMAQALSHRRQHKRAGEDHAIIGLVDAGTGELLVRGLNPTGARKGGYLPDAQSPVKQSSEDNATEAPPAKDAAPRAPRGPNASVTPNTVRGIIQAWQIAVPASIWGWFSIGRGRLRRDDGSEYEATPQGLSDYTWDVFADWHEKHLGVILGLTPRQQADPEVTKRLDQVVQAIRSMTPEDAVQRFGAPAAPGAA
jgi:hypothetical protein